MHALTTGTRNPALLALMQESKRLYDFKARNDRMLSNALTIGERIEINARAIAAARGGYTLTPESSRAIVQRFARGEA